MDDAILLQQLESLILDLDVELRYDDIEGPGGLCRYGGTSHLIMRRDLGLQGRIQCLCRALSQLPLDDVFVRPRLRELIEGQSLGLH